MSLKYQRCDFHYLSDLINLHLNLHLHHWLSSIPLHITIIIKNKNFPKSLITNISLIWKFYLLFLDNATFQVSLELPKNSEVSNSSLPNLKIKSLVSERRTNEWRIKHGIPSMTTKYFEILWKFRKFWEAPVKQLANFPHSSPMTAVYSPQRRSPPSSATLPNPSV